MLLTDRDVTLEERGALNMVNSAIEYVGDLIAESAANQDTMKILYAAKMALVREMFGD